MTKNRNEDIRVCISRRDNTLSINVYLDEPKADKKSPTAVLKCRHGDGSGRG